MLRLKEIRYCLMVARGSLKILAYPKLCHNCKNYAIYWHNSYAVYWHNFANKLLCGYLYIQFDVPVSWQVLFSPRIRISRLSKFEWSSPILLIFSSSWMQSGYDASLRWNLHRRFSEEGDPSLMSTSGYWTTSKSKTEHAKGWTLTAYRLSLNLQVWKSVSRWILYHFASLSIVPRRHTTTWNGTR